MSRGAFIQDVADGLKEKIAMVQGSMDLPPELVPTFKLGMCAATDVILKLVDNRTTSKAEYRIYPVEYVAVPDKEPVDWYDYDRLGLPNQGTNDLLREIWELVSS